MMRLVYPLVASALITIAPFLLTFEKGQDIVRGLFGFEEFALLLLFAWVKGLGKKWRFVPMAVIAAVMLIVAFMDFSNLMAIKGWDMGWCAIVPVATCCLAVAMMWKVPSFTFPTINLILFVALVAHLAAYNQYAAQPLVQFPVIDYLDRTAPKPVERKVLSDDFASRYMVVDDPSVTKNLVDTTRSNVLVLVESWGIPLDEKRFQEELVVFGKMIAVDSGVSISAGKKIVGANSRMYSRTRTAERENLVYGMVRDSATRRRDTTFMPCVFSDAGFETSFLFGGDSTEQWRYKYIRNVGFKNVFWHETRTDSEMAKVLDSLLSGGTVGDSVAEGSAPRKFIAWTTRDTKFPLEGLGGVYKGSSDENDSVYTERLMGTLRIVADLVRKHPDVRFIVQGDHEPILSPVKFQERFYKRWTPFVVLN